MVCRELGIILITIVVVVLVAAGVAACGSSVKDRATSYVAEKGNTYCEKRGTVRDVAVNQLNAELSSHGAKWRIVGIACEE